MNVPWVDISACCMAAAVWLCSGRPDAAQRLPDALPGGAFDDTDESSWIMLVLRMLQVALQQGSSIPQTLEVVGESIGSDCGKRMKKAGQALNRGASWEQAWRAARPERLTAEHESDERRRRTDKDTALVQAALASSWTHGDAPGVRIEAAIEQLDRDERAAIERNAARLSVRLLMPTGLCFLPAFVLIGVIPAIASFLM